MTQKKTILTLIPGGKSHDQEQAHYEADLPDVEEMGDDDLALEEEEHVVPEGFDPCESCGAPIPKGEQRCERIFCKKF